MKKSIIIGLFSLQLLTLVGVAATAYFTFMNKARIRATQRVMVETQEKLSSTFEFMDKIAEQTKKAEEVNEPLAKGVEAPTFALKDENSKEIKSEDLKGKKTLIVFSQESCPYCHAFYPVLNEFHAQKEDMNIVIMQLGSSPEQNKKYKQQEGIQVPLLAASYQQLSDFKVKVTPTSVLLDEEGKVLGTQRVSKLDELVEFVEKSCASCTVEG